MRCFRDSLARSGGWAGAGLLALLAAALLAAACGNSAGAPEADVFTITEESAVQIFLREMAKSRWIEENDPLEVTVEKLLWEDAFAKAEEIGLTLYPTIAATPPYEDGLPGWLIIAEGDFYDIADGAEPGEDTGRRPAIAVAFVDEAGHLAYSRRFTE
jgi:ABC-type glycerol-3-phosphate transport system substrate-binding protein